LNELWILVVVNAIVDTVLAFYIPYYLGSERARRRILEDPVFQDTSSKLDKVEKAVTEAQDEALRLRHDVESLRSGFASEVKASAADTLRSVEKAIAAVQVSPVVQLPQGAVQDAMVSVKASAKKIIRDAVEETLSQLQVTAPEVTPESVADSIVNQQQTEYIASLLAPYVPEQYLGMATQAAQKYGPQVLTALAERFGIELEM